MRIEVRVGLWHDKMAIQLNPETAETLQNYWGHLGAEAGFVTVTERLVYLECSDDGGNRFAGSLDPDRCGGDTHRLSMLGAYNLDLVARCELHTVTMTDDVKAGHFYGDIGPDHLLPWPKLTEKCKAYMCADEVIRQIMLRRKSAIAAGIGWPKMPRIPAHFLHLITTQMADQIVRDTDALLQSFGMRAAA